MDLRFKTQEYTMRDGSTRNMTELEVFVRVWARRFRLAWRVLRTGRTR